MDECLNTNYYVVPNVMVREQYKLIDRTMSVDNYKFTCPQCGHAERQCEGIYLFSDKCYTMLQCPQCNKVRSIQLSEDAIRAVDYPNCPECGVKMNEWNKTCTECGTKMRITERTTDTI